MSEENFRRRMRRVFALILLAAVVTGCAFLMSSCNMQVLDTTYKYDYGIVALPNGDVVAGPVESWCDYEDGDQLQVVIGGITYLTHASNIVLCSDKP